MSNLVCQNCHSLELNSLFEAPGFDNHINHASDFFTLVRCNSCGLVSVGDVTDEDLNKAYAPAYYGGGEAKFSSLMEAILARFARARAANLIDHWRSATGESSAPRVLDIGCGRGVLLKAFQQYGCDVQGVERASLPEGALIPEAMHIGAISDNEIKSQRFDIVVIWHVLEHIQEIDDLLEDIQELTNPGALLVIAVPNFSSYQSEVFGPAWFHLDLPRHVIHFERVDLLQRLARFGFQLEKEQHIDLVQNTYGFVQSALNKGFSREQNRLYELLKGHGRATPGERIAWYAMAGVLTPIAVLESIWSAWRKKGATLQVITRKH